jgi:hypothetical protein
VLSRFADGLALAEEVERLATKAEATYRAKKAKRDKVRALFEFEHSNFKVIPPLILRRWSGWRRRPRPPTGPRRPSATRSAPFLNSNIQTLKSYHR